MLLPKATVQFNRLTITLCARQLGVVIMLVSLFCALAFWQFSRASEQRQQQAILSAKQQAAPVNFLSLDNPSSPEHHRKKVSVTGRYINQTILIENAYL